MSRFRFRGRRRKNREVRPDQIPLRAVFPNLVTALAACAGITSISFSSEGRFVHAMVALLVACVCDGMDGRIARLLKASSKLGAELDSLADFVNFGVAPAMFMYFWLTGGPTHAGCDPKTVRLVLSCALFYAMCDCFRLARFNTMLEATPAPGGCWMVLTPAILAIALDARSKYPALADAFQNPWFGMATLIFVGALMASRLPTISLKAIHFTSKGQMQLFVAVALFLIGLLVCDLWLTLGICGALYILTVPLTGWLFLRGKAKYERGLTSTHDKL